MKFIKIITCLIAFTLILSSCEKENVKVKTKSKNWGPSDPPPPPVEKK